jgi:TolA-binding protein
MNKPEQELEAIANSLATIVQRAAQSSNAADDRAARAHLLLRAQAETSRKGRSNAWRVGLPAFAVAAAALGWWLLPSALHYEVSGAEKDGAYVSAPAEHTASVRFSDHTEVQVEPSSQLRIEETSRRGARVLLERGMADVHVVHRAQTRWTFEAGPFEVLVTGTRFALNWDPTSEVLELRLKEGSVEIQTPFGAAPVGLRAGQNFRADLRLHSMTTTDAAAGASVQSAQPVAPAASADGNADVAGAVPEPTTDSGSSSVSSGLASAAPPSATPGRPWSKLVAAGDFRTVLAEASERGTGLCLRSCSASDLSALADAARYTGSPSLAQQSLQALRARFTRDPEGRRAAFLLGRLSESQGAASDARTWYQRYLNETPGGPYAAEALAGKMRTTLTLDGRAAAQPVAAEYLERYPAGVQATTARGILGSH